MNFCHEAVKASPTATPTSFLSKIICSRSHYDNINSALKMPPTNSHLQVASDRVPKPGHNIKGVPLLHPILAYHLGLVAIFLGYRNLICTGPSKEDREAALKTLHGLLDKYYKNLRFLVPRQPRFSIAACLRVLIRSGHFDKESPVRLHFRDLSDRDILNRHPRLPQPIKGLKFEPFVQVGGESSKCSGAIEVRNTR